MGRSQKTSGPPELITIENAHEFLPNSICSYAWTALLDSAGGGIGVGVDAAVSCITRNKMDHDTYMIMFTLLGLYYREAELAGVGRSRKFIKEVETLDGKKDAFERALRENIKYNQTTRRLEYNAPPPIEGTL